MHLEKLKSQDNEKKSFLISYLKYVLKRGSLAFFRFFLVQSLGVLNVRLVFKKSNILN